MPITSQANLKQNGWELAINQSKQPFQVNMEDLVEIKVIAIRVDETEDPIRSVTHHPLWVKIEKINNNKYQGVLKSNPTHPLKVKDGTEFIIGATINFQAENIFRKR